MRATVSFGPDEHTYVHQKTGRLARIHTATIQGFNNYYIARFVLSPHTPSYAATCTYRTGKLINLGEAEVEYLSPAGYVLDELMTSRRAAWTGWLPERRPSGRQDPKLWKK